MQASPLHCGYDGQPFTVASIEAAHITTKFTTTATTNSGVALWVVHDGQLIVAITVASCPHALCGLSIRSFIIVVLCSFGLWGHGHVIPIRP